MRSTILRAVFGIGIAALLAVPAAARSLDDIVESGVIRVAVPQDGPPFGMTDSNLELVGYDIDMAKLVAEKLDVDLELTSVIGANRVPYLTSGRVDIVISSLGRNAQREEVGPRRTDGRNPLLREQQDGGHQQAADPRRVIHDKDAESAQHAGFLCDREDQPTS